jgi:hypothetical protein
MKRPRREKFTKFDGFKSRLDLLPPRATEIVGYCLRHGAIKYAPNNWAKCKDPSRYIAAMLRHVMAHLRGEFTDLKSGIPHIAAAVTSGLFALDLYARGVQDRAMRGVYFAVVKRTSKRSGQILKRFRSFEASWSWLVSQEFDPEKYFVKSVPAYEKTGHRTRC